MKNVETRKLPMLQTRAAFVASSADSEKRTVDIIWTTGARGLRQSFWDDDYYEELAVDAEAVRLERLNNGAPFLNSHKSYGLESVLGVVERAWIEDGKGMATVRFSERDEVAPIFADVVSGVLRNISVGYRVHKFERIRAESKGEPDTLRAVDWEPMELSLVPIGFDDGAKVRESERAADFSVEIVTRGMTATTTTEEKAMKKDEKVAAPVAAAENVETVDTEAVRSEAVQTERARFTAIRAAVSKAGLDSEFADKLIADGVEIDAARAQIIDKLAEKQAAQPETRSHAPRVEVVETAQQKWLEGARNWLLEKGNVKGVKTEDAGEFRGMSLSDLARDALERAGVKTRGLQKRELIGEALTLRSGYQGTSDFAVLLENTMHKILQGSYATAPDTWRRFCATGSVSDFRAHNRYRLGSFGVLESKNEHGEYKNKAIPDGAKESISVSTKGNIIAITRELLINDDMGAIVRMMSALGRAAGLSIEVDVYAALAANAGLGPTLADGNPVFHARTNANNISTGAALSAGAIDLDRQAMAKIKDISGNEYLDLRPSILLVPLSLGSTAREINAMEYNDEANKQQRRPNVVRGLFGDIVDTPRLSGTRRYLFADPMVAPVLEVAFLDGQQSPYLETRDGWRQDGAEMKVRLDYAVGGVGYEGAITNAGA